MPSIGHVMMGLAAGRLQARKRQELAGSMVLFALVSMIPDFDGIGFAMGIPYGAPFGHRGAMHSLGMAAIVAGVMGVLGRIVRLSPLRVALVTFCALALHDLCDAATDGGLGVALFWPLSQRRIFLPWQPIPVAPIGIGGLLTPRGRHVMAVELAMFAPFLVYAFWPRRAPSEPPKEEKKAGTGIGAPLVGIAIAVLASAIPSRALAGDPTVVPGRMGYNALPTIPNVDPVIEDHVLVELQGATQFSDVQPGDVSFTPYLRLVIPFGRIAAFECDGALVEVWQVSPQTQAMIGGARASATSPGDLRFGARFYVVREGKMLPGLGLRFVTKTTTGKDIDGKHVETDRRFTNAPAYVIDALVAKTLWEGSRFVSRLRVTGKVGFTAWQQGTQWQDDAVDWGVTLQAIVRNVWRVELEARGYAGYEREDKPAVLGARVQYLFHDNLAVDLTVNRGLTRDAPPWEVRLGLSVLVGVPYLTGIGP